MSEFYTSIAPWYDEVFPYNPDQFRFVLSRGADPALSVADIGCGTGTLILALAGVFRKTAGLDPDGSMLEAARAKASAMPANTWLVEGGMLDIDRIFDAGSVDRLICFGNTLPHLSDEQEVAGFAARASRVLSSTGLLLIQLINYDRILDQHLPGLPTLENDRIRFERLYLFPDDPHHIRFVTRLTLKSTGTIIENDVPLLALRPGRLKEILRGAGLEIEGEYGGFGEEPFTAGSQPYIVTCRRSIQA